MDKQVSKANSACHVYENVQEYMLGVTVRFGIIITIRMFDSAVFGHTAGSGFSHVSKQPVSLTNQLDDSYCYPYQETTTFQQIAK